MKARQDFVDYCILMDKTWDPAWFHEEIAQALMDIEQGKLKRLIIEMPPRHGKSKMASILFPTWFLGRNPARGVIAASYNDTLANEFGGQSRDCIKSYEYQSIFKDVTLKEDSKAKGLWKTSDGGGFMSGGVGSSFTGFGADLLILDDPFKNREEADSETVRESKWSWWKSSFYTRLHPNGAIIVINTRWHLDDISGRLEAKELAGGEKWKRIRLSAVAEEDDDQRKLGEALWPSHYPLPELARIKDAIEIYEWSSLYQQRPILAENQEFKVEYFKYFEEEQIQYKDLEYYTSVDLAVGKKEENDHTVITTIAKESNSPNVYIIDQTGGHLDPGQAMDALFKHVQKYRPVRVGIESTAFQAAFAFYVEEEQQKRKVFFEVEKLFNSKNKEVRIRGLIPMYKSGVIFHRKSQKILEEQLLVFPQGKHDDYPDSLEMAVGLLLPTASPLQNNQIRGCLVPEPHFVDEGGLII